MDQYQVGGRWACFLVWGGYVVSDLRNVLLLVHLHIAKLCCVSP